MMTGPGCKKKHTPIMSKAQRGKFGAELHRRRQGKRSMMSGITTKELESHLRESKGKKLPRKVKKRGRLMGKKGD